MEKTFHLSLTVGERQLMQPAASRQEAIDTVIDTLMLIYPDEEDVYGMPEPINEGDLRTFLRSKGLEQEFQFEIIEASGPDYD